MATTNQRKAPGFPVRLAIFLASAALAVAVGSVSPVGLAADRPEWQEAKLMDMEVKVRLVRDLKEIEQLVGGDLDKEFILTEVEIKPLYGAKIELKRDDFLLRTYRNNDTSVAQSPERIAGGAELVLGKGKSVNVGVHTQNQNGIPVGGFPGTGTRPRRIGGNDTIVGGGVGSPDSADGKARNKEEKPGDDLLANLKARELPVGEVDDIVHGYLYFQLNPKEKPKHLTFNYEGSAGEFQISFKK